MDNTAEPLPLRAELLSHLGKHTSISNYMKQLFNLLELSGLDKDFLHKQSGPFINLNIVHICIDCGQRTIHEEKTPFLQISNETGEICRKKTVRIKIIYISDFD